MAVDQVADFFGFEEHDTDIRTEILAGVTTFLAMSYIIVVNPFILSEAIVIDGYSQGEVIQMIAIATILSSALATIVMALYANRPFGLAPGMGLNAFFAFTVVIALGIPWQTALAAVFVEGILFIILTAIGAREYIINLFPEPVKYAVGAGIGVFLLFIGLQEMQVIVGYEGTLVELGNIASNPVATLGVLGVALTLILWARNVTGAIVIGILTTTIVGWLVAASGLTDPDTVVDGELYSTFAEEGIVTGLWNIVTGVQYDFTPIAGAFIEGLGDIEPVTFLFVMLTFFFVDFFDTAGTLIGVAQFGDFLDDKGELPEMEKPLMADAVGTTFGAMVGTSTVTTYIESSTGIEEGGQTGFTALVVAACFLLALPFVALVSIIPEYASFLALVVVGIIMFQGVTDIDWSHPAWAISGALTITIMPLAYSIADGLAAGIIAYPIIKASMGEGSDVRLGQWVLAVVLVAYYVLQTGGFIL
ncbi:NCS2 family permease [Natranaeroarchaeum sulfidigenes]|uniref:Xanthine/uracil/vitamin C permease, AzgA family n=1 Tax=Natranaeroarchaeum sulfidigenes TaxID=2784880 RepID=A0A897MN07_9EURY|nr:NCS2 family permease [Natranaeroarchaeum sulfidigenes]QSG01751.1 Xanthine/uracil/vitamin C permease, AzgA family [Natranaeroarchaeum sulfidigenes]